MRKNQTTLATKNRFEWKRMVLVLLAMCIMCSSIAMIGSGQVVMAADPEDDALGQVVGVVINIVTKAALYVGIVICLWGLFQIVMALRREDSEAIGKQITTVVVGGVLVGFGSFAKSLLNALGVDITTEE